MATVDEDQQQQKEAEEDEENVAEPSNDAAATVAEVNGSGEANNNNEQEQEEEEEEEEEEDLNLLLNPFTKEELHAIVKQVLKKQPSNIVYNLFGANLEEEEEEEEEDLDLQDERLEKFMEPFTMEDLQDLFRYGDPSLTENFRQVAGQVADVNPAHMKILVQVHGFRWDATDETLTSVFRKYGEISEIQVCKHVTDILHDFAFILFKNRSSVREALKQPLKKIGNRWAVCKLASSSSSSACNVGWLLPFFNSLEHSKKALEDLHKVVDGPKGNKSYQPEHGLNLLPEECIDPAQRKDVYTYRELQLQSLLRWLGGCSKNQDMPQIRVTYCNQAAMNYELRPRTIINPAPKIKSRSFTKRNPITGIKSQYHFLQMDRIREMEEKPEATVNSVVKNNHIPHDLAFSIISRLSPKSLKRFGCVCKSWSRLFQNPLFITMYRNNSSHTSLLLKLKITHSLMYLLSGERLETRVRLDFPRTFRLDAFDFDIIASSVNGILCLQYGHNRVVLLNPSTREFKVVPPSLVEFESHYRESCLYYKGFGYDHVRDDYKVIRYTEFHEPCDGPYNMENVSLEPLWELYSLRSDSWKKLDCNDCNMPTMLLMSSNGARIYTDTKMYNGVSHCHWWGTDGSYSFHDNGSYSHDSISCLVSFDLSNELFFTTPMPAYMGNRSFPLDPSRMQLGVINGSVSLISNYLVKTTIEVSILREVGVKESWTKHFTIEALPCGWNLMGVGKNGDIFFENEENYGLAWFDSSTYRIVDLDLKLLNCQIVTYKEDFESLISVGFEKYD